MWNAFKRLLQILLKFACFDEYLNVELSYCIIIRSLIWSPNIIDVWNHCFSLFIGAQRRTILLESFMCSCLVEFGRSPQVRMKNPAVVLHVLLPFAMFTYHNLLSSCMPSKRLVSWGSLSLLSMDSLVFPPKTLGAPCSSNETNLRTCCKMVTIRSFLQ